MFLTSTRLPIAVLLVSLTLAAATATADDSEATKKEAVAWLEAFAGRQVLFNADDVKKLQARVEAMPADEAAAWWEKNASQREALSSPEWLETESWLRKFFEVQAIYSDDDIRAFQAEAKADAKESGESLEKILDRVTQARLKLSSASQSAATVRKAQVAAVEAFQKDQVRQREQARRQARSVPTPTSPAPVKPKRPSRYNEPLVDSLDVARWAVVREIFPRW